MDFTRGASRIILPSIESMISFPLNGLETDLHSSNWVKPLAFQSEFDKLLSARQRSSQGTAQLSLPSPHYDRQKLNTTADDMRPPTHEQTSSDGFTQNNKQGHQSTTKGSGSGLLVQRNDLQETKTEVTTLVGPSALSSSLLQKKTRPLSTPVTQTRRKEAQPQSDQEGNQERKRKKPVFHTQSDVPSSPSPSLSLSSSSSSPSSPSPPPTNQLSRSAIGLTPAPQESKRQKISDYYPNQDLISDLARQCQFKSKQSTKLTLKQIIQLKSKGLWRSSSTQSFHTSQLDEQPSNDRESSPAPSCHPPSSPSFPLSSSFTPPHRSSSSQPNLLPTHHNSHFVMSSACQTLFLNSTPIKPSELPLPFIPTKIVP